MRRLVWEKDVVLQLSSAGLRIMLQYPSLVKPRYGDWVSGKAGISIQRCSGKIFYIEIDS